MDIVSIKVVSDSKMLEKPLLFNLFNVFIIIHGLGTLITWLYDQTVAFRRPLQLKKTFLKINDAIVFISSIHYFYNNGSYILYI